MHCDEVIRELATPSDDRDSRAVCEHLASCLSCASWAKQAAQLDRLWDATRPSEPSPEVWATVWAQMASSLDSATTPQLESFSLPILASNGSVTKSETPAAAMHASKHWRPWNWAAIGLVGIAQAAAILLVVGLTWHRFTKTQPSVFEIDEGRTVVIHVVGSTATVVDLTPQTASFRLEKGLRNLESPLVDDWLLMLNEAESMTKPLVAMKE